MLGKMSSYKKLELISLFLIVAVIVLVSYPLQYSGYGNITAYNVFDGPWRDIYMYQMVSYNAIQLIVLLLVLKTIISKKQIQFNYIMIGLFVFVLLLFIVISFIERTEYGTTVLVLYGLLIFNNIYLLVTTDDVLDENLSIRYRRAVVYLTSLVILWFSFFALRDILYGYNDIKDLIPTLPIIPYLIYGGVGILINSRFIENRTTCSYFLVTPAAILFVFLIVFTLNGYFELQWEIIYVASLFLLPVIIGNVDVIYNFVKGKVLRDE